MYACCKTLANSKPQIRGRYEKMMTLEIAIDEEVATMKKMMKR